MLNILVLSLWGGAVFKGSFSLIVLNAARAQSYKIDTCHLDPETQI